MTGHGSENGFILVATLWVLAALALLSIYINHVVAADVDRAIVAKRSLQADIDRQNTEATLIYLLATGRMNHHALILEQVQRFYDPQRARSPDSFDVSGELRVTGVTYAGLGNTRFSVQDEGGLISVNVPRFPPFAALLGHFGLSEEAIRQVVARVDDYVDADDIQGLAGAETQEYLLRGKDPPFNWIMSSPMELASVLGIEALVSREQMSQLWPILTPRAVAHYNFNTMHPAILAALLDLDAQGVQSIVDEREKGPISRQTQIAMLSGKHLDIDEMEVVVLPSNFFRLALWNADIGPRLIVGIELTPLGVVAPWRKDYRYQEHSSLRKEPGTLSVSPLEAATPLLR